MIVEAARSLSVIVPVLNERQTLPALLRHLTALHAEQIILVDGGSTDQSYEWLEQHWHNPEKQRWLVRSQAGRAVQMNAGARAAQGDMLVFLHADTRLPENAKTEISNARNNNYFWGRFDIQFEPSSRINTAMSVIAVFMNIRSRLSSIATGDQAIFVDRHLFNEVHGFSTIPIMEDIAMSKTLKQHGVPFCSPLKAKTSARRWQQDGVIRTVLLMWALRFGYFAGVPATKLARWYKNAR